MMSAALPPATPGLPPVAAAGGPASAPAETNAESPPGGFARALDAAEAGHKSRAAQSAEGPADTGARPGRDVADGSARRAEPAAAAAAATAAAAPGARPAGAGKTHTGKAAVASAAGRGGPPLAADGGTPAGDSRPASRAEGPAEQTPTGREAPAGPGDAAGDAAVLLAELRALGVAGNAARADTGPLAGAEGRPAAAAPKSVGRPQAADGRQAKAAPSGGSTVPASPALVAAATEARAVLQPLNDVQRGLAGEAPSARAEASGTPLAPPLAGVLPAAVSAGGSAVPAAEARLTAAPGGADFASQLGAQLTTFVREGVQQARLHLHPAELGPVTVRIQVDGQTAQVHMAAEHAFTRQALEQSMPLLAGHLRDAGLTLSGGGVFEQPRQREGGDTPGQPGTGSAPGSAPGNAPGGELGADAPLHSATNMPARRGVVDLVA